MNRVSIITLTLLLMISAGAMATDTRVMTMGENNLILIDDANIWLFPSRVFDHPNLAVAEFSGSEFHQLGIHWKFGKDNPLVLGTYFTDLGPAVPSDLAGGFLLPDYFDLLDNRRMDLFYGNKISDFNFGAHFGYFKSGEEMDSPTNQAKQSLGFFDIDLGLTSESGSWDLALNLGFGGWTDEDADGNDQTEADGFSNFEVQGRYFWERGPDYTFVPHVGFFYAKRGIIDNILDADPLTTNDRTENYTVSGFDLGFGLNYTPAAKVLAVCDFGFLYEKWKYEWEQASPVIDPASNELTYTAKVLPYFKIGMDADVFKWMDIRFGATSYWVSDSDKDDNANAEFKTSFADNETYLGFGFHWKRLHIDTYTDPQLFLDGFNFISGSDVDMNFRISAVYEMM